MRTEKQVFRELKLHGLTLHSDALKHLLNELSYNPSLIVQDVIYGIKNSIDRSKLKTSVVSKEALESAINTLLSVSADNEYESVQVFSAFEIPKLTYHTSTKTYEVVMDSTRKLHGAPHHRLNLYRDRYASIERRVRRNKKFAKPMPGMHGTTEDYLELHKIESLLGTSGKKRVIGMLGQDERKRIYVEDMTSRIYLKLDEASMTHGMFTPTCAVLVEGDVVDDVLKVSTLGFPPGETRNQSIQALSGKDALGIEVSSQQLQQIIELEEYQNMDTFVVLSDVHLDDPKVMKNLDNLLQAFDQHTPALFIFMGNFSSIPVGYGHGVESLSVLEFKQHFDELATILLKCEKLVKHSKFVFVPGPRDPGAPDILPRHPLPTACTEDFIRKIPSAIMSTNPCRIRYFTKDIVILRENLLEKMSRHCLVPIESDEDRAKVPKHVVKTIIDQSHLIPLPLSARPIHWAHDSALQLFPLPDVLILADQCEPYQSEYAGVNSFHPGPFYLDSSFVLYRPGKNTIENSTIYNDS